MILYILTFKDIAYIYVWNTTSSPMQLKEVINLNNYENIENEEVIRSNLSYSYI